MMACVIKWHHTSVEISLGLIWTLLLLRNTNFCGD